MRLTLKTACVLSGGAEKVIPASEVRLGDRLRGLPGETVPVDGAIVSSSASVDESVITGEPIPVGKTAGSEVTSGTTNQFGAFLMRACRTCGTSRGGR
ncbi:hypothetical protein MAF45_04425 [Mesosutterella sp. OilRF-GAM-744-9]|uniref:P-type ATPase A domain-containing protein n=1 Tax=Mesosutterella porci TaxID=2915351 RepID=A0ABS9MR32_9BURK|nr:hypothetical protein [Mesosutterella sp. oilRF-744-WT-GAM-9]MCG5030690.1 hypothetical protein [Mesosutterella sp. oilRF-744-WT-GAM-9]